MSKSTGHLTVAMVALFVAWPFAAVAQSDWQTSPEVRKLYEVARAEGEVVILGAQRRELAWIQEPFGKRFPGIEVKWTADRSAATKLITEYRAGRFAVDLFHFPLGGMLPVDRRCVLATNDMEQRARRRLTRWEGRRDAQFSVRGRLHSECYVRVAGTTIRAQVSSASSVGVSERVWLTFNPERCTLFASR